jgi:hypothetical protein
MLPHLSVMHCCDKVHECATPLMPVDDITAVRIFFHPAQRGMTKLLVGVRLDNFRYEVVGFQAIKHHVVLGVDLFRLLAHCKLLTYTQESHLQESHKILQNIPLPAHETYYLSHDMHSLWPLSTKKNTKYIFDRNRHQQHQQNVINTKQ